MNEIEILQLQVKVLQEQVANLFKVIEMHSINIQHTTEVTKLLTNKVTSQSSGVGFGSGQGYEWPR